MSDRTVAEKRLAYLGREMMALSAIEENGDVSSNLGRVGNMLTKMGTTVKFEDFTEMDLELIQAVAEVSRSGVEV